MTGPKIETDGTLAMFRVIESMPFDRRKVKQRIRELGLGRLEIKTRGAHLDPSAEQKRLTVRQDGDPGCVFLFAVEGKVRAVITTRCAK